ncbi:MAG: thioredoxin family protein [Gemmatimonadota bacterium]
MMQRIPLILSAAALAAALGAAGAEAGPLVGQPAPTFELVDADGQAHRLADYRGRIVVLEWTNQTCPFVMRHYREGTMKQLRAAYPDSQVAWLAINTTHNNTPEQTRSWSVGQGIVYPTLLDADGAVGQLYEARTTPHMFVIDGAGILRYDGAIDDDPTGSKPAPERVQYVRECLDALLAGQTPPHTTTRPYGCSVKYAAR